MAFAEVAKQAGRQFDPVCAAAFMEIRESVVQTMREMIPGNDVDAPGDGAEPFYVPDPRG